MSTKTLLARQVSTPGIKNLKSGDVVDLTGITLTGLSGGNIQNPRELFISSDIGNDATGNGTPGAPWLTVAHALALPLLQPGTLHLANGGYGSLASPINLTVTAINWHFLGVGPDFSSEVAFIGTFTSTGTGRLLKIEQLQLGHGSAPAVTWDDANGGLNIYRCDESTQGGSLTGAFLHATANARKYAFLTRCDLTSNLAAYNVVLDDLPAGQSATLYVKDCQGMRASVGAGWSVQVQSGCPDALFAGAALATNPTAVTWSEAMPNLYITILASQAALNAVIAGTSAGYYICTFALPTGLPAGAGTGDVLLKPAVAGYIGLYRKQLWAPPTITALVGGVPTPYRQTAAGWASY